MLRRLVPILSPFNRVTIAAFLWRHRRTIRRWGQTLLDELRGPERTDPKRWATTARILWVITSDDELRSSPKLRRVELDGSTVVIDADQRWSGLARLVERLSDIDGVDAVEDLRGRRLSPPIDTVAA